MQQEIKVSDPRAEAILTAYHQVVVEQLDQGLRDIEQKALEAMREIAIEIWRTSGAQGNDLQERILASLSRDDALKGLIQHSDERFQNLALRVQQIEDSLMAMSNATRELRSLIVGGAFGGGGGDTEALAKRLDDLEQHLASAFQHLAERDFAFLDTVKTSVADEAGRAANAAKAAVEKVEEVETQLKSGASAMSDLVKLVQDQVATLSEIARREIDIDPGQIERTIDDRVARLAALVRSDSQRLAELVQRKASESGVEIDAEQMKRAVSEALDARLGRMSELVSATTMSAVNEVARHVPDQAAEALDRRIDDVIQAIDKNFVGLVDITETEMHRMGRFLAERTAELVDGAIANRLAGAVERIDAAAQRIEQGGGTPAAAGLGEAASQDVAAMLDDRITALAKMIRSDNRTMAEIIKVAAEQQASKHAARVVTELAANLPNQIMETLDRRFGEFAEALHRETQSTVVAVAKAADVIGERIDRNTAAIAARTDREIQAVNDKFGRAVHELAKEIR